VGLEPAQKFMEVGCQFPQVLGVDRHLLGVVLEIKGRLIHQSDILGDVCNNGGTLGDIFIDYQGNGVNLAHGGSGALLDIFHLLSDIAGSRCGLIGQRLEFAGNHGKSFSSFTSPGGFNGGIQGQ